MVVKRSGGFWATVLALGATGHLVGVATVGTAPLGGHPLAFAAVAAATVGSAFLAAHAAARLGAAA